MTNEKSLNDKITDIATYLAIGVAVISWAVPQTYFSTANANLVIGGILIGLNLVRIYFNINISRNSFMIGSFLMALGLLSGATLMNPMIFPLGGIMIAAYHISKGIEKRQAKEMAG